MSEYKASTTTKVGVLTRVIATAIDTDRRVCLATFSLMPWIASDGAFDRSVTLETWPEDIEAMLANARLFVSPVDPGTSGKLQPDCGALGIGIPLRRSAVALFPEYLQKATTLWQQLIAESDDSVWPALAQMLKSSQAGETLNNVCASTRAPASGGTGAAQGEGAGGATSQPGSNPPDVFDYPRADAALLYGFQRAREVLRAMAGSKGECRVGKCTIKTGGRFLDLADFTFDRKPWLGLDGPLVRLAQATQSDAPASTLAGFARSDQLLAQERTAQEASYRRQLADKTKQAKKQATQRNSYLTKPTVGDRITALKQHAQERATSLPPSYCADACSDTTDDSIANQLTDDVKSAHGLGSLPDVDQLGNAIVTPNELDDAFEVAIEQARQRLFAITSMPSLARLFNLVIDVEFDLDDLLDALGLDSEAAKSRGFLEKGVVDHYGDSFGTVQISDDPSSGLRAHYMFLICNLGRAEDIVDTNDSRTSRDPPRVWTLTKFRMPISDNPRGAAGHFWPCTREEVDVRLSKGVDGDGAGTAIRESCAVFQYDGIVDLGVTYCGDDGTRNPRYDIVSLDTIQTVESDIQSDRRLKQQADTAPGNRLPSTDLGAQTRRTGGLAVLDRWRQDQVVSQVTTAQYHTSQQNGADIILDAEDMTSAYRLDVAVDVGGTTDKTALVWRCLMNRKMSFGGPTDGCDWLESAITAIYHWRPPAGHAVERRRRADSASLSIASRLRDNGVQRDDRAAKTAFGEQIMIAWHGDPLGVDCLDPHGSPEVTEEYKGQDQVYVGLSMPATGLPLEVHYDLEERDLADAYRPPPLRYGWPYHLGLRPVYLGGVILPLELAIPRYELNFGTGSSLPSPAQHVGRRFLRHERIEAPLLTVPADIANKQTRDSLKDDPAKDDTGATCLLRTSLVNGNGDDGPTSTVRILFPPVMQLEQAALHSVFDNDRVETVTFDKPYTLVRPIDGLKPLDFTGGRGGVSEGGFPHAVRSDRDKSKEARGPAIFQFADPRKPRPIPFYPDPAATSYVIAVRRPQSDDYLAEPIPVPAYPQPGERVKVTYPDVLPLAIEIKKRGERAPPAQRVKDIFPANATLAYADSEGRLSGSRGGLAVRHIVAELAQGEDFEIEVWCAPSADALYGTFDIVESVAILLMRESATEHLADGRLDQACVDGLKHYFKGNSSALLLEQDEAAVRHQKRFNPLCGPGGISLPQAEVMKLVATGLVEALRCCPIPELAATTRIHAIHAVNKPLAAPSFVGAQPALRVVRLNDTNGKALLSGTPAENPKVDLLNARGARWQDLSDDGATNAIFDGTIDVDLLTTHDIELRATMVSPASAVFDDVNRGRSSEEKARGALRLANWIPGVSGRKWPSLPQTLDEKQSQALYGFIVGADDRVSLSKCGAPLLALHSLPETPIKQRSSNTKQFCLLEQQQLAAQADSTASKEEADSAFQPCRAQYLQPFRDGLARKLQLTLVATSRFSNLFKKPSNNEIGQELQSSSQSRFLWLPATKRPDALSAKSLRPAFVWTCEPAEFSPAVPDVAAARSVKTAVRTCLVRLPFDRPHFTSGEGERVGIVIWPPDLMVNATVADVADDHVRRSEQNGQKIKLDDKFSDSDLGPGGEYVSRWGADPAREGPRPPAWLIPKNAFLDHSEPEACADDGTAEGCPACGDPKACAACGDAKAFSACCYETGRPVFVRNVLMPIPRKPDASQGSGNDSQNKNSTDDASQSGQDQSGDAAGREFMLVSLLTYEPRFDIDYERWYVDFRIDAGELPEPFIRLGLVRFQPHARPEMQVSEPIAQWVQLMPKRTICVAVEPPRNLPHEGEANRVEVAIEVKTPAEYDGSAPLFDPGSGRASAASGAPFMRACVLRQETISASTTIQTVVSSEGAINSQSTQLLPQRTDDGTVWSGTIEFSCHPALDAGSKYSVFVEEVQAFNSTADPYEAGTGERIAAVVESGPRFAAIVPIAFAPEPAAPAVPARPSVPTRPHRTAPVKSAPTLTQGE
jgi:hypothetical protein